MPKCGDKGSLMYEVESGLIGKVGMVWLVRKDGLPCEGYSVEFTNAKTQKVEWPDQKDEHDKYYSGRKVDFRGLEKLDYHARFKKQEFELALVVGDSVERSGTTTIEGYPDVAPTPQNVGIGDTIKAEMWEQIAPETVDATGRVVSPASWRRKHGPYNPPVYRQKYLNCGRFDIELKNGVVIITVKIFLESMDPTRHPNTDKAVRLLKKRVETFWNSESDGYNQFVYHRKNCARKYKCQCVTVRDSKGKYVRAGCCKFPFQVKIEKGSKGAADCHDVKLYFLDPTQRKKACEAMKTRSRSFQAWGPPVAEVISTQKLYYPENRANTYAHEVGHMMGFPDQYDTGLVAQGAMSNTGPVTTPNWPIDKSSIMGEGQGRAKKLHLAAKWFNDWIDANVVKDGGAVVIKT
jgi:hypothetical protein